VRRRIALHAAFWFTAVALSVVLTTAAPTTATAASVTSTVYCTNTFAPTIRFNLPLELDTTVTGTPSPGGTVDVDLQATVPLSEGFIAGVLTQVPSLTSITVNRVFVSIPDPVGATAQGGGLDVEFVPGDVNITSSPGVPISGGVALTSPVVSDTFDITGGVGDAVDFELDPALSGSGAATTAGGTVWGSGGKAAAIELDLTILGVVKVGFDCTDGGLTQSAGPDTILGTADDVFNEPVTDNAPFLSFAVAEGSTTTQGSTTSSTGGSTTSSTGSTTSSTGSTTSTTGSTTSTTQGTTTTTEGSTTTAAPLITHLEAGSVDTDYLCVGADEATANLLAGIGDGTVDVGVVLSSDAISSPAKDEQFDLPLRWTISLDPTVIETASGLGITSIEISNAQLAAGVSAGASGPDFVAKPPSRDVSLAGSGTFHEGPFLAPFTRTGDIGDPITVVAKHISMTATIDLGGPIPLKLSCDTDPASFSVTDKEGAPPPPVTPTSEATEATVLGAQETNGDTLPRTGADLLWPLLLALGLIDLGLLAHSSGNGRLRRTG